VSFAALQNLILGALKIKKYVYIWLILIRVIFILFLFVELYGALLLIFAGKFGHIWFHETLMTFVHIVHTCIAILLTTDMFPFM
jgi:hypothetical protein